MLLSLHNNRIPFRSNAKFILFLIPTQLIIFALIYHLPFQDVTSWRRPLRKIGWSVSTGFGLPPPPSSSLPKWSSEDNPSIVGALVAGVMNSDDVQWMGNFTSNWTIHVNDVNNVTTHFNKGHESMVYLEHILDNWDTLAPVTLFIHGHFDSWHQDWPMDEILRTLNLTEVEKEGYVNLRCAWEHGCPDRVSLQTDFDANNIDAGSAYGEEFLVLKGITEVFPFFFPNEALPDILASPCCAQFAVTRDAIRARGRDVYERMSQWIMETKYNDHVSGTIIERLWAYTLRGPGKDPVFCMSPQYCRCKLYNKCSPPPRPYQYLGPVGANPFRVRFKMQEAEAEEEDFLNPDSGHPSTEEKDSTAETENSTENQEGNIEQETQPKLNPDPKFAYRPGGPPLRGTGIELQRGKDKVIADHGVAAAAALNKGFGG